MKISTAVRNSMMNGLATLADAGSAAAFIRVRTGSAPTNVSDADSGTLLATCTMSDPSFGSSSAGTITANAIAADSSVDNTGTAGYFRMYDSDATCILQGSVGTSATDMVVNSTAFVSGGTFTVTSLTVTQPVGS